MSRVEVVDSLTMQLTLISWSIPSQCKWLDWTIMQVNLGAAHHCF
eukprot:COSAG02_NODE_2636_length_8361_cov_6.129993_4_plen_45_part_00